MTCEAGDCFSDAAMILALALISPVLAAVAALKTLWICAGEMRRVVSSRRGFG